MTKPINTAKSNISISERDAELAELMRAMAEVADKQGDNVTYKRLKKAQEIYLSGDAVRLAAFLQAEEENLPLSRSEEVHYARYCIEVACNESKEHIYRLVSLFEKNAKGESFKAGQGNRDIFHGACDRMQAVVSGQDSGQHIVSVGVMAALPEYLRRAYILESLWNIPRDVLEDGLRRQAGVAPDEGPRLSA